MSTLTPPASPDAQLPLRCEECRYDLRGTHAGRCPECGTEFSDETFRRSRVPWVHRREIGTVRAFFATLWMVLSCSRFLPQETDKHRTPAPGEAAGFRLICVFLAAGLVMLPYFVIIIEEPPFYATSENVRGVLAIYLLGALTFNRAWWLARWYTEHSGRDARLALVWRAIGDYTAAWGLVGCAVFGLTFGSAAVAGQMDWIDGPVRSPVLRIILPLIFFAAGTAPVTLSWLGGLITMVRLGRSWVQTLFFAINVPLLWLAILFLYGVGIPGVSSWIAELLLTTTFGRTLADYL